MIGNMESVVSILGEEYIEIMIEDISNIGLQEVKKFTAIHGEGKWKMNSFHRKIEIEKKF